jgi:Kdo2-lipid IVA lauroyltransferase/acyltransferase
VDGKNRFRYLLEYAGAAALFLGLKSLPAPAGKAAGRSLGRFAGRLLRSRTRRAEENLLRAFPDASADQVRRWARECWENLGQAAWEFTRIPRLTSEEYFRWVKVEGVEHLNRSREKGKGVVLFTAHYTNWELTTQFVVFSGHPLAVIARRMKNPYVNEFISRVRSHLNVRVFMHKEAVRESIRWLKQGNVLGLLLDQRITDGGLQVPFFGRPAHTTGMPALLGLRLGSPVHPVHCWREGDCIRLRVDPAMDFSGLQANEEGIRRATEMMTLEIEKWARERPPMWLWIHNRWKP